MQNIIERIKSDEWFVKCENIQQYNLLTKICREQGFRWSASQNETLSYLEPSIIFFPMYIGVDLEFFKQNILCYTNCDFNCYRDENNLIEDITELFFGEQTFEYLLTPIEKYKIDLLLAIIREQNIEQKIEGKWNKIIKPICEINLENLIENYRIDKKTPLIIPEYVWNAIDPKFKYAAMDENKRIYFYKNEPTRMVDIWGGDFDSKDMASGKCFGIDITNINWKYSLVKRPTKE